MQLIASFPKSRNAEVRVVVDTYKRGRTTVDLRVWFVPKDGGERVRGKPGAIVNGMVRSKRGLQIDHAKLPALIEALQKAQAAIRADSPHGASKAAARDTGPGSSSIDAPGG